MFLSGLKTNVVVPLPPQRIPIRVTLVPLVIRNTCDPLSPASTIAAELFVTRVWHRSWTFEPKTLTVTHVFVTVPAVQPVVLPTLLTVPLKLVDELSCPVMENAPSTVSEPVFTPVVLAMTPRADSVPEE